MCFKTTVHCLYTIRRKTLASLGRHVILELWGCCKATIDNVNAVKEILVKATEITKANLVDVMCHRFSPYGVTGVAILAESHISVHTWPEYGYAAVDIFICSNAINPQNAASYIAQAFHAKETSIAELKRGNFLTRKMQNNKSLEIHADTIDSQSPLYLQSK